MMIHQIIHPFSVKYIVDQNIIILENLIKILSQKIIDNEFTLFDYILCARGFAHRGDFQNINLRKKFNQLFF